MTPPVPTPPERFVVFACRGDQCIGVVTQPPSASATAACGVVIVVGGPQYRVGSHRQFVLLARALATAGIPTLRFDYRGMGDSDGAPRTFEDIDDDIAAAVDCLVAETGVASIVLWGLCDGATAAFMYAPRDPRVAGVVALNPWARSPQGQSATLLRHHYLKRVVSGAFWRKVLTGGVDLRAAARGLASTALTASDGTRAHESFLARTEDGWRRFGRPVLLVLSGNDFTAREFESWVDAVPARRSLRDAARTQCVAFADADHTFSDHAARDAVAAATLAWIGRLDGVR